MSMLYGKSIGEEARYRNKTVLLGPGVNIYRTPLNGRNFEYMGEDPYLAGRMVVPYVQGVQQNGVAACVKHYALNNQEVNRHTTNVIVDDRALYEIYLPAFKAAVQEGKAWSIMGAYNLYKGQHACHNQYLLNDILKGEWGFDGIVVSDWASVAEMMAHGFAADSKEAAMKAVNAGVDMEMVSYTFVKELPELIKEGKVKKSAIDDAVRNILRIKFRLGLFDNPYVDEKRIEELYAPSHLEAAKQAAVESAILLKNEKETLPLQSSVKTVAVVGPMANAPYDQLGTWIFDGDKTKTVTPLKAIKERV